MVAADSLLHSKNHSFQSSFQCPSKMPHKILAQWQCNGWTAHASTLATEGLRSPKTDAFVCKCSEWSKRYTHYTPDCNITDQTVCHTHTTYLHCKLSCICASHCAGLSCCQNTHPPNVHGSCPKCATQENTTFENVCLNKFTFIQCLEEKIYRTNVPFNLIESNFML